MCSSDLGPFEIRVGPYGPYMFKSEVAKKQFVSVPAGVNIETLTEAGAMAIFQAGLQANARKKAYKVYGSAATATATDSPATSAVVGRKPNWRKK